MVTLPWWVFVAALAGAGVVGGALALLLLAWLWDAVADAADGDNLTEV